MAPPLKIGVLISGRGSNLQAIIDAIRKKELNAEITLVISNKADALGLERAQKAGIPLAIVLAQKGESRQAYEHKLIDQFTGSGVMLVVLAGFMRILSPYFISHYKDRIINIHPSLLPSFPGLDAQRQALEYGAKVSGATVHIVDPGCDTGPIILQEAVPVHSGDTIETLSARILEKEHRLLPKAIDLFAGNKVKVSGRVVHIQE